MIQFSCPNCKKVLEVPDEKAGVAVHCPQCKQPLTVPSSATVNPSATVAQRQEPSPSPPPLPIGNLQAASLALNGFSAKVRTFFTSNWTTKKIAIVSGAAGGALLLLIVVLIAAMSGGGRSGSSVDARTLLSDYTKDREAADLKYKGKVLQIEGVVPRLGLQAVYLEGGTEFKVLVQCNFGTAGWKAIYEHNRVVRLKKAEAQRKRQKVDLPKLIDKGNTVVIKGTCNGLRGTGNVVLDNCEVIDPILVKE